MKTMTAWMTAVLLGAFGGVGAAAVGEPLAPALSQDFFQWFQWQEVSRAGTTIVYGLNPKSQFVGLATLTIEVDAQGVIVSATLSVQQAFIDGKLGAMAEDLMKSFVRFVMPEKAPASVALKTEDRDGHRVMRATRASPAATVDWNTIYLAAADLPGLRLTQDSRDSGPDAGDRAYADNRGVHSGMAIWMAPATSAPVWRLCDIRWVFPDDAAAQRYLDASWKGISEGQPEVKGDVGVAGARIFGGTSKDPIFGLETTQYFVAFRVGRVVVKLFVAQGPEAQAGKGLTLGHMSTLAQAVVARAK